MDELLTAEELAAKIRVKPATIRVWAQRGLIPHVRPSPKVIRFLMADVVAVLRESAANAARQAERDIRDAGGCP